MGYGNAAGLFGVVGKVSAAELEEELPAKMKKYIAENNIQFYTIDAVKVAKEVGLKNRINMVTQTAFFKLTNVILTGSLSPCCAFIGFTTSLMNAGVAGQPPFTVASSAALAQE